MSNLRQAAQQALEAWFRPHGINYVDFKPYMEALRAALAEPEQEPVAQYSDIVSDGGLDPRNKFDTAPTPRKPLTDEEIDRITDQQWGQDNHKPIYAAHRAYARAIEAKLKEKNA